MADYPANETDESIVARVIDGDIEVYATLMLRYEARLRRYVVYLIHDQAAAEDIVQETFIKAYQNLRGFNAKYKFSSWIYRIAHNVAMDTIKANRHVTDDDVETLPDTEYDQQVETLVDRDILRTHVRGCMDDMDQKYRDVVQLVYFEHMKYDEVSDVLHVPVSTVGVWLSRAKSQLKQSCRQKGVRR